MYYLRSYWPWFKVAPAINSTWFLLQFQRRFRFFSAWKSLGGGGSVLLWYSPHRWTLPGLKVASWLLPCCCPAGPLYLESNRPSIERTLQLSTLTQDPLSLSPATAPASPSLNQLKCLVTGCVWNVASPKFLWLPKYYYYCKILEKELAWETTSFSLRWQILNMESAPAWTEQNCTGPKKRSKLSCYPLVARSLCCHSFSVFAGCHLNLRLFLWRLSLQLWWLLMWPLTVSEGSYVIFYRSLKHRQGKHNFFSKYWHTNFRCKCGPTL